MKALALALLLLPCARARAADPPSVSGKAVDTRDTELARRMKAALKDDPAAADSLAGRILESSLADQFEAPKRGDLRGAIRDWILQNPADAAFLAVGFAKDDREGNRDFEKSLYTQVSRSFELNPSRDQGLLGRLKAAGSESQGLVKDLDMDDDERRELLRRMFEGGSKAEGRVGARGGEGGSRKGEEPSKGLSYAGDALYDRLSAGNPTGYSPQVQQLQSELNLTLAPGAPKLIETGRLDYPTLHHPYYALAYDAERLDAAYSAHLAWAQARSLGLAGRYSAEQYRDPAVQRKLDKRSKGKAPPSFARRREALDAAAKSVKEFDVEAERTKDPKAITAKALKALSAKRRDAARWIVAAALEEDLSRLEQFRGFLTPLLVETIRRAAPDPESAELYLKRGAELEKKVDEAAARMRKAVESLRKDSFAETLAEADSELRRSKRASRILASDIALYTEAPGRLEAAGKGGSSGLWARLEDWLLRLFPNASASRRIAAARRARAESLEEFLRMAQSGF
ncbi:MAG: hypothetical protein HY922_09935 [Elusimicrobia bacterium]|nr:hypothetical protein [Elusimicrobiota bacterium]